MRYWLRRSYYPRLVHSPAVHKNLSSLQDRDAFGYWYKRNEDIRTTKGENFLSESLNSRDFGQRHLRPLAQPRGARLYKVNTVLRRAIYRASRLVWYFLDTRPGYKREKVEVRPSYVPSQITHPLFSPAPIYRCSFCTRANCGVIPFMPPRSCGRRCRRFVKLCMRKNGLTRKFSTFQVRSSRHRLTLG